MMIETYKYFLMGLLACSLLTGLTTEGLKKVLDDLGKSYKANILAGVVSVILGAVGGILWMILNHKPWTVEAIVVIIVLIFLSWLCSMVGYDKVIQTIMQIFKRDGE